MEKYKKMPSFKEKNFISDFFIEKSTKILEFHICSYLISWIFNSFFIWKGL